MVAYNDETLEELWRFNVGTALKGAPVTYAIGPKSVALAIPLCCLESLGRGRIYWLGRVTCVD